MKKADIIIIISLLNADWKNSFHCQMKSIRKWAANIHITEACFS